MTNPQFYVVATPIGNRQDISTRAMQILSEINFIVAEDTRHTGQLMAYYGIKKPLISWRAAPRAVVDKALRQIHERILAGESGALVSDAGTPGVSDPGWRLVKALGEWNITVAPIPGASAAVTILSVVDVAVAEYRFIGFLPKKKGHQTLIADCVNYLKSGKDRAVIFFESPRRIQRTLGEFLAAPRPFYLVIGRELTKHFETIYRGNLNAALIATLPQKGEYTVVVC